MEKHDITTSEDSSLNVNATIANDDNMEVDTTIETTKTAEEIETEKSLAALDSLPGIEEQLSNDRTNYELLVRKIEALKLAGLPDELELAREAMHDVYPLTEQLWLDWIEDAKKEASTEEGEVKLRRLYLEADQDYLSNSPLSSFVFYPLAIPIWSSYVDFITAKFDREWDALEDKKDPAAQLLVENAREDLLKAVRATTYHVEKSHIIWNAYADFETKLMEAYDSPEQYDKLKQIYLERLKVLHLACDETFAKYSQLNSTYDNNNYEANLVEANKIFAATKEAAEERDYYEQYLKDESYSLDAYYQYIENEKLAKKMKSLNYVRNLYERAVAVYCTDVGLWEDYICFMLENAHVLAFLSPIALRAVRNCPWSGTLWSHLARFIESSGGSLEEVVDIFDRAMTSKALATSLEDLVALMMAKCAHARRQVDWDQDDDEGISYLRLTFQEALMYIDEAFPKSGDPYYRVEKFWATVEGQRLDNVERAREIWDGVIKKQGRNTEAWINYIDFERSLGNIHSCRSLFKQAIAKNLDYPERLMAVWQSMEYEEGSVESLEQSIVRINKKSKLVARDWQTALAQQEVEEEKQQQKDLLQKVKKSAHRRKQKESKKSQTTVAEPSSRKRKQPEDAMDVDHDDTKKLRTEATTDLATPPVPAAKDNFKKPAFIPRNQGARGGRGRGAARRGGRLAISSPRQQQQSTPEGASDTSTPRSNDDFRAMLLAGKK
ncbi:hypothetical protein [Absidia glauca]|uniref:Uncharacterized protein n=1 Tax=Absidia glauca TaxID=4829 RepID=A0A163KNT3_ABSGL|nr:hypothetical protein [Absidia glauca]